MLTPFQIEFDCPIDEDRKTIHLIAKVDLKEEGSYYTISGISTSAGVQVLPNRNIVKSNNRWVHMESGQPTSFSAIIGKIIDTELNK
jgi:hypothetical protein